MDINSLDNFKTLIIIFILLAFLYLFVFKTSGESFEVPVSIISPAPAAVIKKPMPYLVPREVSPSGPNPPNARIPEQIAKMKDIYNVIPSDPMDELYGSQNIQDNLRYPERFFGPGIVPSGTAGVASSGVGSHNMLSTSQPIQPFSTELVQNGGLLDKIGADDTHTNPNYASF